MTLGDRLARLVPDLSYTIVRFPVCCLVAAISFFVINLDVAKVINLVSSNEERVYLSLAGAFLAGGAGHLFAEGRKWPILYSAALAGGLAAAFGLVYLFHEFTSADPLFLYSAAALLVMTAGYLRRGTTENALWLFNARFGLAAILAFVVALVFCGGLSAILASLDYLFDISIRGHYYSHIWGTGATIIAPVYGLSLIPRDIDEELRFAEPPNLIDRGISLLINYILAPMILIYLVILYLYAGKIGLQWSLPKGQIGIMVLVFGLGGTATYLIAGPWAARGTRVLRWFLNSWFWLTIVPVCLLMIAVYRRVTDYGVTPERYGLIVIGIWLAAMVVYFSIRRRQAASRTILLSLGLLLLVSAFGPWGARGLSIVSQMDRLQTLLADHGYLKEGKLAATIPDTDKIPAVASSDGASIIQFLRKKDALDRLKPLFAGREKDPFAKSDSKWSIATSINDQLGFRSYGKSPDGGRHVYFAGNQPVTSKFGGNTVLHGPVSVYYARAKSQSTEPGSDAIQIALDGRELIVVRGVDRWQADAVEILRLAEANSRAPGIANQAFRYEVDGPSGKAVLVIANADGELDGSKELMRSMTFWVVLPSSKP